MNVVPTRQVMEGLPARKCGARHVDRASSEERIAKHIELDLFEGRRCQPAEVADVGRSPVSESEDLEAAYIADDLCAGDGGQKGAPREASKL